MAQIIKHRRGSINSIASVTANVGELVMATGSVGDLNAPVIFVGDTAVAGGYKPVSKIYQGTSAPDLTSNNWGTTLNGTPFYSSGNQALNILNNAGNTVMDLTGNIEGNVINSVTINTISGNTNLIGDLLITGDTYQTGSITLTGDVTLRGNINIGDNLTGDTININGEISASLIPAENNAFDLGSTTNAWRDLHVSGTAYIENINLSTISVNSISLPGNLIVSGTTTLSGSVVIEDNATINGNLDVTGSLDVTGNTIFNGDVTITGLTDNRVVIVGSGGLLEDDANFTFNGTELNIGVGNFTVQQGSGNVDTAGTLNVGGATTLESSLDVTGSANFKNNVIVSGTTTISGSTYVQYLTDNRIIIAGAGGKLEDDANFTFDGTVFNVGQGKLEIDVADGDIRTSGSLTIQNGMTINGNQTVNGNLTVTGNTIIYSDLYVSGNVEFLASASYVHISASIVELDDNIIRLNAYSPFERYAGFEVIDSGSSNTSASLVWDSLNDYWMFVSSSNQSSKLIGTTAGTYGSEISLTNNTIPKATGTNTIGNSLLTDNATTLAYNTNKFTVESVDGATLIAGNVTLSSGGGADANSKTSAVLFRNSSNVIGYVSTTETTDVLDGILGYKNSNGGLIFSTVIDGGTYS